MTRRQIRIGLTGSIGMGKSTVAAMFAQLGVPVFDADAAVHALQGPGGRLVPLIAAAFGDVVVEGSLDRARLRAAVLGDPAALTLIEDLVHPAVAEEREAFLRRHAACPLVLLDIPLLFETHGERGVDAVVVVSAPRLVQRRRVLARAGMTDARLHAILRRQMPNRKKRRRASFVIGTGGTKRATRVQVRWLVACLRRHGVRYCRRCARSSSIPKPPA